MNPSTELVLNEMRRLFAEHSAYLDRRFAEHNASIAPTPAPSAAASVMLVPAPAPSATTSVATAAAPSAASACISPAPELSATDCVVPRPPPRSSVPAGPPHSALRTIAAVLPVPVPVPVLAPLPRQILCSPGVAGGGGGAGGPIRPSQMDEGGAATEDIAVYLGHGDCLHNDGQPLLGGETISFKYANAFPSELSVRVATCIDSTMPATVWPAPVILTKLSPTKCSMYCRIEFTSMVDKSIQSCFSSPACCSWDAVLCRQHRPWPPPTELRFLSCDAGLRPLPWPLFNMVEGNSITGHLGRLWKPSWYVSIQQQLRCMLAANVESWKCLMRLGRLVVFPVPLGMSQLDPEVMNASVLSKLELVNHGRGSDKGVPSVHIIVHTSIASQPWLSDLMVTCWNSGAAKTDMEIAEHMAIVGTVCSPHYVIGSALHEFSAGWSFCLIMLPSAWWNFGCQFEVHVSDHRSATLIFSHMAALQNCWSISVLFDGHLICLHVILILAVGSWISILILDCPISPWPAHSQVDLFRWCSRDSDFEVQHKQLLLMGFVLFTTGIQVLTTWSMPSQNVDPVHQAMLNRNIKLSMHGQADRPED